VRTMPNFSTIFFFFTLANMSLPGTSGFIGRFLILVGALVSRNLKPDFLYKFSDLNGKEVSIFLPFLVGGETIR
jgi:NADH-ubiquinone oxidoreductase chain 4